MFLFENNWKYIFALFCPKSIVMFSSEHYDRWQTIVDQLDQHQMKVW